MKTRTTSKLQIYPRSLKKCLFSNRTQASKFPIEAIDSLIPYLAAVLDKVQKQTGPCFQRICTECETTRV